MTAAPLGHHPALVVARFTLQEAVSRRLILAGLLISFAFLGLYALGYAFAYQETLESISDLRSRTNLAVQVAMLTVLGLFAVSFLSSFLALFLSVGAISAEIDSGALHAVLARPLHRRDFVIGRWLALAGLVAAYVLLMAGLVLLLARLLAVYEPLDAPRALALMALQAILLLSLSLFGSTWLSTLANGVVSFSLFGIAWLGGIIEVIGGAFQNEAMVNVGIVTSLLVPSDGVWRAASYYLLSPAAILVVGGRDSAPFVTTVPPAGPFVAWALAYTLVLLLGAVVVFEGRDL